MENKNLKKLKTKANNLPLLPGVYIMKNASGDIIYVGKAIKLKNRVTQYFGAGNNHTAKVKKMVSNVYDFDYIICDSEFEALTLENSLIKQHQPKYNILLKDDKGYHYIRITDEKWRKIEAVKSNSQKGEYIGPYNSGRIVRQTVEEAKKVFKLPVCNRNFDKKSKPCLNYHIGLCDAPCMGKITLENYNESISSAVKFIKNGGIANEDISALKLKMEKAAEELNFEYAAKIRDRIRSIEKIHEKQKVILNDTSRQDVFATALAGNTACTQVFTFKNGHLYDEEHFLFNDIGDKSGLYSEFLIRYYEMRKDIPQQIYIDLLPPDSEVICKWLSEKINRTVNISAPKIADKKRLVDMCLSNASDRLAQQLERNLKETSALNELAQLLNMPNPPRYIEAYDISNTAGDENVAGMIVIKDGRPYKQNYRRFKIKGFSGQDDYRSMAEVMERRLNEYEKGTDAAFSILPDLILLDGGKGQISAVKPVIKKHNLDIPLFGMVKDSKHRTDAITDSDEKIAIKPNRKAFTLVTTIQDEVHRFAISFHKNRKSTAMLKSQLSEIKTVGSKRAENLFKHFKTITAIKQAGIDELCKVDGISKNSAEKIYEYFHGDKDEKD